MSHCQNCKEKAYIKCIIYDRMEMHTHFYCKRCKHKQVYITGINTFYRPKNVLIIKKWVLSEEYKKIESDL